MSTSTTIGLSLGKFIGNSAAYAVHGAARAASATGEFGKGVAAGATEQYAVKNAELQQRRLELAAQAQRVIVSVKPAAPQKNKAAVTKRRVAA